MQQEQQITTACDRPGCPNPAQRIVLQSNPAETWQDTGLPDLATDILVHRCSKHLHQDGHFSVAEYRLAQTIVENLCEQSDLEYRCHYEHVATYLRYRSGC